MDISKTQKIEITQEMLKLNQEKNLLHNFHYLNHKNTNLVLII